MLPYMPALQPYRGKPAVRNDRGDRGNVGIIRSPVRASILPDWAARGEIPRADSARAALLFQSCSLPYTLENGVSSNKSCQRGVPMSCEWTAARMPSGGKVTI